MTPIGLPTPENAIDTLDQAVGLMNANRQTHAALQQCITVLQHREQVVKQLEADLRLWRDRADILKAALQEQNPQHPLVTADPASEPQQLQ